MSDPFTKSEPKVTREQIGAYQRDGYLAPIAVLEAHEANRYLECFESFLEAWGKPIRRAENLHRVFPWAHDLACRPLNTVAGLIAPGLSGRDLVIWGTLAFCKYPQSPGFVPWHQDSAYTDFLAGAPSLTAWIALTHSNADNGCMRASPGTHLTRLDHGRNQSRHNLLRQQHQLEGRRHDATAVDLILRPGEMSLHHLNLIHSSNPNVSTEKRLGFIVRCTTLAGLDDSSRKNMRERNPAGLITAEDRPPQRPLAEAMALYARITNRPS